eukprot:Blabericola_migrator_1__3656@NODE_2096_length_3280_cov_158_697790_g1327_i0_p2_GENE_NODE_2096_length_3280_cov_158_697790_g1327_i0NODE_2096_length_3280_cov_158_697790_g1327_i0_p2_ORF_typecomplete_len214_score21_32GAPT/PF11770_8/1_2e03GAPT/PF11770_8/0_16DUF755/PF05501_11/3_9SR25/PF10500_9/4_6_NODE_2096_length_3280_cov_158_697790_g1327_i025703211
MVRGQVVSITNNSLGSAAAQSMGMGRVTVPVAHEGLDDMRYEEESVESRQPVRGARTALDDEVYTLLCRRLEYQRRKELGAGLSPQTKTQIVFVTQPGPTRPAESEDEPSVPRETKLQKAVRFQNELQAVMAMNSPYGGLDTYRFDAGALLAGFGLLMTLVITGGVVVYMLRKKNPAADRPLHLSMRGRRRRSSSSSSASSSSSSSSYSSRSD